MVACAGQARAARTTLLTDIFWGWRGCLCWFLLAAVRGNKCEQVTQDLAYSAKDANSDMNSYFDDMQKSNVRANTGHSARGAVDDDGLPVIVTQKSIRQQEESAVNKQELNNYKKNNPLFKKNMDKVCLIYAVVWCRETVSVSPVILPHRKERKITHLMRLTTTVRLRVREQERLGCSFFTVFVGGNTARQGRIAKSITHGYSVLFFCFFPSGISESFLCESLFFWPQHSD